MKILHCKFTDDSDNERNECFDISTQQKAFAAYHFIFRKLKRHHFLDFIIDAKKNDIGFGCLTKEQFARWKCVCKKPTLTILRYFVQWAWKSDIAKITDDVSRPTYVQCKEYRPKIVKSRTKKSPVSSNE